MRNTELLQQALNINSPWFVGTSDFNAEKKRLDIEVDLKAGARFACPDCKAADYLDVPGKMEAFLID